MNKPKAKTLADAFDAEDPDTRTRKAIDARIAAMLEIGPQEWDYEEDFAKAAGLNRQVVSNYRPQYKKHWAVAPKKGDSKRGKCLWFADPVMAQKFRDKVGTSQS